MRRPRVRPKIELVVELPPSEVLARFKACMAEHDRECKGSILGSCVEVTVIAGKQHFWSPQLSLQLDEHEQGTLIYGRVGPQPQVWTLLVALYAIVGISSGFAMFFAFSQWLLGQPLSALWALPLGIALAALVYGSAWIGQRLGAEQTHDLARVVTRALDLPEDALHV
jgi:hypothetical protein